ncbi:hypothetical protein Tco_0974652 [Tanacetum coccineum]|uniref:Uncharacterized protein n=1 Tax=Tanacetum coccineum TaxID=301880 RepID=A0ABQ5EC84_9ASTR
MGIRRKGYKDTSWIGLDKPKSQPLVAYRIYERGVPFCRALCYSLVCAFRYVSSEWVGPQYLNYEWNGCELSTVAKRRYKNGNVVNENAQDNVGNVIVNGNWVGCSYKEFLACTLRNIMAKEGVDKIILVGHEKMEVYICTLSREVAVSMSWNDFKFMMIQEFCPSHEMQKLEYELWNNAMGGAGHAAYTDRFHEVRPRSYHA